MSGYSEVFYVMFSMLLFSMILTNSNRLIQRNVMIQINGELEQEVIALAQEIIEEAQSKEFDQSTVGKELPPASIPGDFTSHANLGIDGEASRRYYDDFDDYNGHSEIARTQHGDFSINVEVFYVDEPNYEYVPEKTTFKKIIVSVESVFLNDNSGEQKTYSMEFIRNYYAD
jgi:hypothetical protein